MIISEKIKKKINNIEKKIIFDYGRKGKLLWIPDVPYTKWAYRVMFGHKLDLRNPQTYNQKLQWMKLYYVKPEYIRMADKYTVKDIIASKIGEEHIIPTIEAYDSFDEINFDKLPDQFVLKCNHDSGGIVICDDKSKLDIDKSRSILAPKLSSNFYWLWRERIYKTIKPKIIAEKFMGDNLTDYKFFCFDGKPVAIQVDIDRFYNHKRNMYTTEWKLMDMDYVYPSDKELVVEKPEKLDEMLEIAKKLSTGIPHVRVDLYQIDNKVYFGEMTFCSQAAVGRFFPSEYDLEFGKYIDISKLKKEINMK